MTLEEKVAQLGSVWAFEVVGTGAFDPARAGALHRHGIGQITRLAGATNLAAPTSPRLANEIQRLPREETRLGIPAIVHEEIAARPALPRRACLPAVDRRGGDLGSRARRGDGDHDPPPDAR